MDYDPDLSQKSSVELNVFLSKYTEEHELYARALTELARREKAAEERISSQISRSVFWSRLAAVLALPGALYVLWRIVIPLSTRH